MNNRDATQILVLAFVLGIGAAVIVPGFRKYRTEGRELVRDRALVAKLADEARREERRARDAAAGDARARDELAAAHARAANASATPGARFRWTQLVKEFRTRLAGRANVNVADFRLLTARDWLEAALNAEGGDDANVSRVINAMHYTAQKRLGEALQGALRRYVEANGKLPPDVSALLPLLPANIDAAMLAHFKVTRTGAPEPRDQPVLEQDEQVFAPLRLTVDGWNMRKVGDKPDATTAEDIADLFRAVALNEDTTWMTAWLNGCMKIMPTLAPNVMGEETMNSLGQDMKQAAAKYWAEHGNTSPQTVADVAAYMQQSDKLFSATKEMFATMQYMLDHEGAAPADRTALQPYIDASKDPRTLLRQMKLTFDGDRASWSFEFKL